MGGVDDEHKNRIRMNIENELNRELWFSPFIESVLNKNIHLLIEHGFKMFEVEKASVIQDTEQGFDFWFTGSGLKIPVRIRQPDCKYRDFTIRWRSVNGGKTEIDKLSEGAGDVYFYAWTSSKTNICDWVLINLHELRSFFEISRDNPIIIKRVISNGDGTYFTHIKLNELQPSLINITSGVEKTANKKRRLPIIQNGEQGRFDFLSH